MHLAMFRRARELKLRGAFRCVFIGSLGKTFTDPTRFFEPGALPTAQQEPVDARRVGEIARSGMW